MKTIDWQLKRMPTLARIVHYIFISEYKSAIKKEVLLEKIRYSDYSSANIEADFDRLVNKTDRWLNGSREILNVT
jgi:hypothetical protein